MLGRKFGRGNSSPFYFGSVEIFINWFHLVVNDAHEFVWRRLNVIRGQSASLVQGRQCIRYGVDVDADHACGKVRAFQVCPVAAQSVLFNFQIRFPFYFPQHFDHFCLLMTQFDICLTMNFSVLVNLT